MVAYVFVSLKSFEVTLIILFDEFDTFNLRVPGSRVNKVALNLLLKSMLLNSLGSVIQADENLLSL